MEQQFDNGSLVIMRPGDRAARRLRRPGQRARHLTNEIGAPDPN